MKKYYLFGAIILLAGLLVNYKFGGFKEIQPVIVEVENYVIWGSEFEGSYKSSGLTSLVEEMRSKQSQLASESKVVIINYIDEAKETLGVVSNFVGLTVKGNENELVNDLEERIIRASKAIRIIIKVQPLTMPSPEKIKAKAFELASKEEFELQGLSVEQYNEEGYLIIDFPIKAKEKPTFIEQLADAYGIENFDKAKTYHYTFNVKVGDAAVARSWTWNPNSGDVTLMTKEDTTSFNHKALSEGQEKLDHTFINDKYWLLFPFHLIWDTGYSFSIIENVNAPISELPTTQLIITYNDKDGYTPGDAYDLFINNEFEIVEWSFRKGGQPEPSLTTTWEGYQIVGGINIATDHQNDDGTFRLWFTDIIIE